MTTQVSVSRAIEGALATVLSEITSEQIFSDITHFQTHGLFTPQGEKLTHAQAQDRFDANQKVVLSVSGDHETKIFKLFYGTLQVEQYKLLVFDDQEWGRSEWYAIQHKSADNIYWWRICRVKHYPNGEMLVSPFPGKIYNPIS